MPINAQLVTQTLNMDELFEPHVTQWFAMEKQTAVPIRVKIRGVSNDIPEPAPNTLENAQLQVKREDTGFSVFPMDADFSLGRLNPRELRSAGLYTSVGQKLEPFVVTRRLPPDSANRSIYRKQAEIVEVDRRVYVIAVVEVDHEPEEGDPPYAKFAIGEVRLEVS
jgi:hypothetical protein